MIRTILITAALVGLVSSGLAADPAPAPTIESYADALGAMRAQRDQALDQAVGLSVELAAARREIERLRKEVAAKASPAPSEPKDDGAR